jgi:hypothetical protein
MTYHRPCRSVSSTSISLPTENKLCRLATVLLAILFSTFSCIAQNPTPSNSLEKPQPYQSQPSAQTTITIPAGTELALVLTQPVQSRYIRRGDDVYAQITSPVDSGNQVAIPAGTFVDGKVDKIEGHGGRAELRLQSMSITFPDGYVAPISGPATLETGDGYALKDPGRNRTGVAIGLIGGGAGLGAIIGHSVGSSTGTLTATLPPGCVGGPPYCTSSSITTPGRKGIDTGIGLTVGAAIGGVAAFALSLPVRIIFFSTSARP